ncbi:LysR substrate-binding domain-containing protein [Pseudomonas typographi]|uniref:LysR family transcriptional regulator n=1 Tax=Pseudomonas typographi TaxID=2715964 RepID=A0ABR7Z2P5_9PSED|nr:LysR substrate-binding domain-containing protein [Pseudomonas typographi]MBD1550261.1 LysR family transcriptional regulator [Pseudomonas typographi]MBD1599663.1 LysR family transcriptional regulator [Pseudomonas typographi]
MNKLPLSLSELRALATIATYRSYRKAADELGLSASTLSHMMRTLEANLGVRLLNRTTRSVAVTAAGAQLLKRLAPLLREFELAVEEVNQFRELPSGTLRINASEPAARILMEAILPRFLMRFPQMSVDLVTEGRLVDIVANGFDAGIRLAESVPQDMIAVPIGADTRFVTVASPAYLASRSRPLAPDDLLRHPCICIRMPSGKPYRWEFEKRGQALVIDVKGQLTLDNAEIMADAAVQGLGIAYVQEHTVARHLAAAQLVTVLEDWCPRTGGLFLYYPGHRHIPAGLQAFIEVLRGID